MLQSTHAPSIRRPTLVKPQQVGWLSLILASIGMILIFFDDPYWLSLPISGLASAASVYALQRGPANHPGAHLGLTISLLNVFIWLLLIVLMGYYFGIDPRALFVIPSYE